MKLVACEDKFSLQTLNSLDFSFLHSEVVANYGISAFSAKMAAVL
jgi:hypothetical protein